MNPGMIPVHWSGPSSRFEPAAGISLSSSIGLARKMSCIVTTSDSMRSTSVT